MPRKTVLARPQANDVAFARVQNLGPCTQIKRATVNLDTGQHHLAGFGHQRHRRPGNASDKPYLARCVEVQKSEQPKQPDQKPPTAPIRHVVKLGPRQFAVQSFMGAFVSIIHNHHLSSAVGVVQPFCKAMLLTTQIKGMVMKQIELGRTGIMVSDWCLGTMTFSTQTPTEDAHRQIDMCLDAGINFLDTAEMYPVNPMRRETVGDSERCIANWVAKTGRRKDVIIATKAGGDSQMIRNGEGYSPDNILDILDANLDRLGTDYIDLYQLHWPMRGSYCFRQNWTYDPSGQNRQQTIDHMGGVLEKLKQAQAAGKIRSFGLSNETAWGTTKWIDIAEQIGAPRVASVQNEYSLLHRLYDTDMAEMSVNEDVVCFSYSPLATGLLTGKYQNGNVPDGSRMTHGATLGGRVTPRAFEAVDACQKVADKHGMELAHLAMAFQRARPFKVSAIFGATTSEQLAFLLKGKDIVLSDEVMADIDIAHRAHPMPY